MSAIINEMDNTPNNSLFAFNPTTTLGLDSLHLFFNNLKGNATETAVNQYVTAIAGLTDFLEEVLALLSDLDNFHMETAAVIDYRALRDRVHDDLQEMEISLHNHLSDKTYLYLTDANRRYLKAVDALSVFDQDDEWDLQIHHDAEAGLLDDLMNNALTEYESGKCQRL